MSVQESPFKFLDSYQQADHAVFFGREKETKDLYNALSGVKVLLVYGPSGSGKTSLIECGLRNQFSDADWYALTIRRGSDINASVFSFINRALSQKIEINPVTKLPIDSTIEFSQAVEKLFAEHYQPIYLLFDQFEELLISGTTEEKKNFFMLLNKLILNKVPCRVLIIMREEFIGHLSEFESLCPSIFQHRFRVEKMGRNNVEEVLNHILSAPSYNTYFKVEDSHALAESILSKLPDKSKQIELAHVQVFLRELWDRAQAIKKNASDLPVLNKSLIYDDDNLESVLESFLKKQIKQLEGNYGAKVPLEVLAAMITDRSTKLQISADSLIKDLEQKKVINKKPIQDLLNDLEQRRIIRSIKVGDETQYEISHDVLALVVGQNRTEEMKMREKAGDIYKVYTEGEGLLTQDDIDYLRPFKEYLPYPPQVNTLIDTSVKNIKKVRRKKVLLIGSIIAVALVGLIAWSIYSRIIELKALKAQGEAVAAKAQAQELLEIALRGRGEQYKNQHIDQTIEVLRKERNNPIESLLVPKANATPVTGTKNYDFLIWIDVPSFRLDEIKQVEYRWPCKGFADSVHVGKEPALGFAFGFRGWGYCPTIMIEVIPNQKFSTDTINILFNLKEHLEKSGN